MEAQAREWLQAMLPLLTEWSLKLIGALAVLIIGRWLARRVRKLLRIELEKFHGDATLVPFVSGLVYYLLLSFVVLAVLGMVGVHATSVIAVLGAAGLAVGLALQGTLSNFASGVMLLVFRPFKVGDYIDVEGATGTVKELNIFSTLLHTPDNVAVVVPNSNIYGHTIKNFSANDTRRIDLVMGISYDDDIQLAIDTIKRVVKADSRVLTEPETQVAVSNLGDSSVDIVVRPWCNSADYWTLRFDLTRALKEQLETAGCSIPYPQRDVHLQSPPAA